MIIVGLVVLGLCAGSFVNALVWRLHEQEIQRGKKTFNKKFLKQLSISKGRSMCPHCHHGLVSKDLIPVLSWLNLGGKCRYCHKPISSQYPIVELLTGAAFVGSYVWWPQLLNGVGLVLFVLWLLLLTGLAALLMYDIRWMVLPNRIMYPLGAVATLYAFIVIAAANRPLAALLQVILAVAVGGGIFYGLFQFSQGKWIGGGDVKLGWLLGLLVGTPTKAFLLIFLASIGGSLLSLPLLLSGRLKRTSTIPFGPLLIMAAVITILFGGDILDWYQETILRI